MAGTLKVDSINADSNLALKIANTAVAFIDATGLRPTSGNVSLDATATSKLYLPSANTVAIQTAGVTGLSISSSQVVTLANALPVTSGGTGVTTSTGTGAVVLGTSPVLTTPALGTPSALVLTNATGLPQAGLGTNVAGNGPAFGAWLSTSQSVTSTVGTTLACNTEEYDTGGCYNNTGSTVTLNGLSVPAYSFCPNVAGYYIVNAGYSIDGVSSFSRALISCSKNGSNYKRLLDTNSSTNILAGTTLIYLNGTGDYVYFYGYIAATGTLSFNGGSVDLTWVNGAMVRSA